jgi:hypothetical protein
MVEIYALEHTVMKAACNGCLLLPLTIIDRCDDGWNNQPTATPTLHTRKYNTCMVDLYYALQVLMMQNSTYSNNETGEPQLTGRWFVSCWAQ